jgi:hypothetical protein
MVKLKLDNSPSIVLMVFRLAAGPPCSAGASPSRSAGSVGTVAGDHLRLCAQLCLNELLTQVSATHRDIESLIRINVGTKLIIIN